MRKQQQRIMFIGAHPDDGEYYCGGAAALWAARGHRVCFASVTNGQAGHQSMGAAQLVQRRAAEADAAAALIGAESRILPIPDGHLEPKLEYRLMLIRMIREFAADLVITHRPNAYHPDHRYTAQLVQDSAFMLTVPQVAPETPALRHNPVILYAWDYFKKPVPFHPNVVIDIDSVFDVKIRMLDRHASQFYEWNPWLDGVLDRVPKGKTARRAWFKRSYIALHQPPVADCCRRELVARYGPARGNSVRQAEAFECCEYGAPLDERRRKLFFSGM